MASEVNLEELGEIGRLLNEILNLLQSGMLPNALNKLDELIEILRGLTEKHEREEQFMHILIQIYTIILGSLERMIIQNQLGGLSREQLNDLIRRIEYQLRKIIEKLHSLRSTFVGQFQGLLTMLENLKQLMQRRTAQQRRGLEQPGETGTYWYVWWKFDNENDFEYIKANHISPFQLEGHIGQRLVNNVKVRNGNITFTDANRNLAEYLRSGAIIALGACRLPNTHYWKWDGKKLGEGGIKQIGGRTTSEGRPISEQQVQRELRRGLDKLEELHIKRVELKNDIHRLIEFEKEGKRDWESQLFWERRGSTEQISNFLREIRKVIQKIANTNELLEQIIKDVTPEDKTKKIRKAVAEGGVVENLTRSLLRFISMVFEVSEDKRTPQKIVELEENYLRGTSGKKFIKSMLSLYKYLSVEEKEMKDILYQEVREAAA